MTSEPTAEADAVAAARAVFLVEDPDFHGGRRDECWINTTVMSMMLDKLTAAAQAGAPRVAELEAALREAIHYAEVQGLCSICSREVGKRGHKGTCEVPDWRALAPSAEEGREA